MLELDKLSSYIRTVDDYPKPGIRFRDITPLLENGDAFRAVIEHLADRYRDQGITKVVGIEARGFIFATALAFHLNIGFVPLRKPGKLPAATFSQNYALEYGTDALEIHQDALGADDKVIIIDDLLATGGTLLAAHALVQKTQAQVHECAFLIVLDALPGPALLANSHIPYYTLFNF